MTLFDYCKKNEITLPEQWHPKKNGALTAHDVSHDSDEAVWWQCAHGHEWQTSVKSWVQGSGCPICNGRVLVAGVNDFAALHPTLAAQWHPQRNGDQRPDQVMSGTRKKFWWLCEKGHEWEATVKSRTEGKGCPVCSNKIIQPGVNDLATTHPQVATQWHPTKNDSLTPRRVTAGSQKKVWWLCEKGHEWEARVSSRVDGTDCPICANRKIVPGVNDLASFYPHLAAQWAAEKNGALRPEQVSPYSNRRAWWQCDKGHQWQSVIAYRTMGGSDCPYCAGRSVMPGFNDLQTLMPEIARDWHPTMNAALTPEQVTVGSSKRVWWQCAYGHVWKTSVISRTGKRKHGCPVCAGKIKSAKQRYYEELEKEANLRRVLAETEVGMDPMVLLNAISDHSAAT